VHGAQRGPLARSPRVAQDPVGAARRHRAGRSHRTTLARGLPYSWAEKELLALNQTARRQPACTRVEKAIRIREQACGN
jgi:hypothetical protein